MTSYKHHILPAVRVGSAAVTSAFATFMASRLRHTRERRGKAALADWEEEGGSVVAPAVATPSS
jgi:hypothetical protein